MTAFLLVAGVVVFVMVVAGIWLMHHAAAEPAARAVGRAPDPEEEREAQESFVPRSSFLVDRPAAES
ncbi:MAG TPA: hypothetical protein VNC17_03230 [Thermoleophilaceae bacterium]|jgi:hypothetical protein|nr:hypothetical protein [Thermoleophilaceae bacterium]